MKKIAIFGAGGFGREVKFLIDRINQVEATYDIVGFYDDAEGLPETINGIPYLGKMDDLNQVDYELGLAVAIGEPNIKEKVISNMKNSKISFPTLIDPSVIVSSDNVSIGQGCIVCAGNIITTDISIEDHVILNLSCTVGHDTVIKKYCSFMPTVNISGEVAIAPKVYVGTGAKIINQLEIGENTTVGAGAVVAKSLPANCVAVGMPAKAIKFKDQ